MKKINSNFSNRSSFLIFILIGFLSCSSDSFSENDPVVNTKSLATSSSNIEFDSSESTSDINVTTDAEIWTINSSNASWLSFSQKSGTSGSTVVSITAAKNTGIAQRTAEVTLNATNATSLKITISQTGLPSTSGIYPDYNTNPIEADAAGMSSSAQELAAKISLGWNIGNSLEAAGSETAWGNPKITKQLIDLVKQSGFNAVRIPCSWDQYLSNNTTAEIKTDWLNRVKEVIQYCVENEMYVIVNIHWDGGWLENNVTESKKEENNAKQKAFWEQIAIHFRDFDEHLLFASANEPNVEDAAQMAVLKTYHQTFIDAVRSTGGKNAFRTLVVQGPSTDIEKTSTLMTTLPNDTAVDRMMVEVHYYTPYQFCLMSEDASWGNMFYYWGAGFHTTTDTERNATWGEEADLKNYFKLMKDQFITNGIPVILGEFAAMRRTTLTGDNLQLHLNSRAYYLKTVVKEAKTNGLLPFYWDAGGLENNGSGLFDRNTNTVFDTQALNALLEGML